MSDIAKLERLIDDLRGRVTALECGNSSTFAILVSAFNLTHVQALIVAVLLKRPIVTTETLYNDVFGLSCDPPAFHTLEVHLCKARAALRHFGIVLPGVKRGVVTMSASTRAQISKAMIGEYLPQIKVVRINVASASSTVEAAA